MKSLQELRKNPKFLRLEEKVTTTSKELDSLLEKVNNEFGESEVFFWLNAAHTLSFSHIEKDEEEMIREYYEKL